MHELLNRPTTKGLRAVETTNVTLRMEKGLKESADKLFASLGLTFSSAVNLFVRKALRTQSIPFEVSMSTSADATNAQLALLESLLASPTAQRRLASIGKDTPSSYDSLTSMDDVEALIRSVET
jgi:DNA-damage-inducible protein J